MKEAASRQSRTGAPTSSAAHDDVRHLGKISVVVCRRPARLPARQRQGARELGNNIGIVGGRRACRQGRARRRRVGERRRRRSHAGVVDDRVVSRDRARAVKVKAVNAATERSRLSSISTTRTSSYSGPQLPVKAKSRVARRNSRRRQAELSQAHILTSPYVNGMPTSWWQDSEEEPGPTTGAGQQQDLVPFAASPSDLRAPTRAGTIRTHRGAKGWVVGELPRELDSGRDDRGHRLADRRNVARSREAPRVDPADRRRSRCGHVARNAVFGRMIGT